MLKKVEISMKKVAIVSCDKWMNKINEDLLLKQELIENNVSAEIISWEDKSIDYSKFDCLILRSAWGYQNKYLEFKEWLQMIKSKNILLLNNPDIIIENIQKNKQFNILRKNNIPLIDTNFVYTKEDLLEKINSYPLTVVKPIISGSGQNTYLIRKENLTNLKNILNELNNILTQSDNGIMIQPYINGIENGEYACIFIDGINTHNMLRYPGIFSEKKKPIYLSNIPYCVKKVANDVSKLEKFLGYLYMRVDIVLQDGKPKIMEVELAEPDLLFKYIENERVRDQGLKLLSKSIVRRIK